MKKRYYIIIMLFVCLFKFSTAQILCIKCYDQNDSISSGVNNLLLNGGFESSNCTPGYIGDVYCPSSSAYSCNITNWTCTGGGANTYACLFDSSPICRSIIAEGLIVAYPGNYYCKACSPTANDTSCINDLGCEITGVPVGYPLSHSLYGGATGVSLEQTATGLITGNTYVLEFWAGGEQNSSGTWDERGLFAVDVGFGNTLLRCKPTPQIGGIGTRYIIEFDAVASTHVIKFTNWGHICSNCTEVVLDDIRLYILAELDPSVPPCLLGIDNTSVSKNLVSISPNPFSDKLNITTNNNELSEIILYDIASRKLLQQTFTSVTTLNTAHFAKGIYIYEVRNKTNGVVSKGKLVKE